MRGSCGEAEQSRVLTATKLGAAVGVHHHVCEPETEERCEPQCRPPQRADPLIVAPW